MVEEADKMKKFRREKSKCSNFCFSFDVIGLAIHALVTVRGVNGGKK